MPLYEYDCPKCGQSFEKLVRSSANADKIVCPHCSSPYAAKKLSTFVMMGSPTRSGTNPALRLGGG